MPAALTVLVVGMTLIACGAPAELSRGDGETLALARDRIDAARQTEARMRTVPASRGRLHARVRRIVADGSLEAEQLDEFGLAAIGQLRQAVPSLVLVDRREIPRELDRPALRTFVAYARRDPARALRPPVEAEVERIADVLEVAEAGPDTEIPVVAEAASDYLEGIEDGLRPIWPELADEVAAGRAAL